LPGTTFEATSKHPQVSEEAAMTTFYKKGLGKNFSDNLDEIFKMTYNIEKELGQDHDSANRFAKKMIERIINQRVIFSFPDGHEED
jgi:hypothetical protein